MTSFCIDMTVGQIDTLTSQSDEPMSARTTLDKELKSIFQRMHCFCLAVSKMLMFNYIIKTMGTVTPMGWE